MYPRSDRFLSFAGVHISFSVSATFFTLFILLTSHHFFGRPTKHLIHSLFFIDLISFYFVVIFFLKCFPPRGSWFCLVVMFYQFLSIGHRIFLVILLIIFVILLFHITTKQVIFFDIFKEFTHSRGFIFGRQQSRGPGQPLGGRRLWSRAPRGRWCPGTSRVSPPAVIG